MGDNVPRRMRRFYRKGEVPPDSAGFGDMEIELDDPSYMAREQDKRQEIGQEITMHLALDEVQKFKEQHKRLPKKEEYDKIAESIYTQLKDQAKRRKIVERYERKEAGKKGKAGKHGLSRKDKAAAFAELKKAASGINQPSGFNEGADLSTDLNEPAALNNKDLKDLSVEDLFGEGKKKQGKASGDDFSLEGLSGLGGPAEKEGSNCPNCQAPAEEVIFCPECGSAFCEKCAKKVEKLGNVRTIVCPSCGTKIKK